MSTPIPAASDAQTDATFEANILRLVKGARECRAIKSGQVDAIIDPGSGRVILLPDAQAALLENKARFRSLVELSSDGYWEQDEHYRFVLHTGAAIGNAPNGDATILGKTLWELAFDNNSEVDWPTHRTQLEWRAIFRDLEFSCMDRSGKLRIISLSGEPMFDAQTRFTGYRGITRDITERKRAEIATLGSDPVARSTLDALATRVCVLDASGTIITANAAWRVFAAAHRGSSGGVSEGRNYLAACDATVGDLRVDAVALAAGIRQVIAGEREMFRYEYGCDLRAERRWFMATITRLRGDGAARTSVAFDDITELKHAEQLLRLEYTVARCLANVDTAYAALQGVMRAVCEAQRWDCSRYFRLNQAAGTLHLDESWRRDESAANPLTEKSLDAVFRSGTGVAGRVCQSGQPLWILPNCKDGTLKERAMQTALAHETDMQDGAFVFPVIAAGNPIGVLAFTSPAVREPDERLLQAAQSIGNQLGHFLQRQQVIDTVRQSEARFRRLTELSSDWVWEQDDQFRFTKIVGTGMAASSDVLGKTLWELPNIVVNADEWIKHKSELAARWSFCDFECAVILADGQLGYYCISGEPLYDASGVFTGFHGTGLDITQRKRAEIALCAAGPN
jgi:PAS domain S-box-containing protein